MANTRARQLRKTMTPQEVKLWVHLRSWKSRGYHFRRQAPREKYIVDFVCLRKHLIVELDGGL
jgi:very-short-patch-repair endonuclease